MLLLLYKVFSLLPRKNQIVCLSRQSDQNPIDFLLIKKALEKTHPDYEAVILSRALKNKLSYCAHMVTQLKYIATSKLILLDSYCIVVSLLADHIKIPVIQMWHAMGNMKKFGYSALGKEEGRTFSDAKLFKMHQGYDCIFISSNNFIKDFAEGFGVNPSIIIEAPLPKTDLLIDSEVIHKEKIALYKEYPQLQRKKNIVYCPTFRKEPSEKDQLAIDRLIACIDFEKYNFIYKAHPVSTLTISDSRVIVPNSTHNILYAADYVISDYSTVIYEAGLLNIPVYLYGYDWNEYKKKRSLNINIKKDVPTLVTDNPEEIIQYIENNKFDYTKYYAFTLNNITLPKKGTCTKQIIDIIFSFIQKEQK